MLGIIEEFSNQILFLGSNLFPAMVLYQPLRVLRCGFIRNIDFSAHLTVIFRLPFYRILRFLSLLFRKQSSQDFCFSCLNFSCPTSFSFQEAIEKESEETEEGKGPKNLELSLVVGKHLAEER